jgi:protein TonB
MKNQTPIKFLILLLVICAWMAAPSAVIAQETVQKEVDEMPVPPGGIEGFTNYMIQNLKYPATAKDAKIEGMVMITFVVKSDGSVDAVEVLRGIGGGCDEEAVRVVKNSGIWTPGKKEGKAVAAQMTLPVQFKM